MWDRIVSQAHHGDIVNWSVHSLKAKAEEKCKRKKVYPERNREEPCGKVAKVGDGEDVHGALAIPGGCSSYNVFLVYI